MSADSAPLSGRPQRPWLRALLWLIALTAGLLVGAAAGYYYGHPNAPSTQPGGIMLSAEQATADEAAVRQNQAENRYLRSQLDTADGELVVERAARQAMEVQLHEVQEELGRVRERLAFFEQLLPPGPEGSVDIRGVQLQREGHGLTYQVLLMRSGRGEMPFSGALRFQALGTLRGESITVDLTPMQLETDAVASRSAAPAGNVGLVPVQFDQYQRSQGILQLPEGFVPDTVTVSVLEGTTVRASRSVKLEF